MRFKEFLIAVETNIPGGMGDYATGAYTDSAQTGSETSSDDRGMLPSTELGIINARPVSGTIFKVRYKEDPVKVGIMDANHKTYQLAIPRSRFDELRPEPKVGRMMNVIFQGDTEQIDKITVQG